MPRRARRRSSAAPVFRFLFAALLALVIAGIASGGQYAAIWFAAVFLVAYSPMVRGMARFAVAFAVLAVLGTFIVWAYRRSTASRHYGPHPGSRFDTTGSAWSRWLRDAPVRRSPGRTAPAPRAAEPEPVVSYVPPPENHSIGGAFEVMRARRAAGYPVGCCRSPVDPPRAQRPVSLALPAAPAPRPAMPWDASSVQLSPSAGRRGAGASLPLLTHSYVPVTSTGWTR
jgi:hypothetical protein